jgi:hypothetical protein
MPTRQRLPPAIGAAANNAARATAVAAVSVLALASVTNPRAGASEPAATQYPPLGSLVVSHPIPGYKVAPYGPSNGPLTGSEYASQSSAPQLAQNQFSALATQTGFGAAIRLWSNRSGPDPGANDVAVLLFRIPDVTDAKAFEVSLRTPFSGSVDSSSYVISSIPGAQGYSVQTNSPVHAVEQVVVFRAGEYVAMVELASSLSGSNPTILTPSQAVAVGVGQYWTLGKGDPVGSRVQPAPANSQATVAAPSGRGRVPVLVSAVAVAALIGGAAAVLLRRRRRPVASQPAGIDPWGPGRLFESFGATVPDPNLWSHPRLPAPTIAPIRPTAGEVPALAPPEQLRKQGAITH